MSKYEIEEKIGDGGMGEVYRAMHLGLKRLVAIKFIRAQYAVDPFFRERFERERLIISRLDHPGIIRVYDGGEDYGADGFEGRPYLVMEWLEGETLVQRLMRGRMTVDEAIKITKGVLSALDYAHSRPEQVIHRDVKPSNVFLCEDGSIKLLDFGIAKALSDSSGGNSEHTSLTVRVGTVEYMAPEQIISGAADPRTDIYMVGILLYEMLAGRPPFKHKEANEVYNMQVKQPPPALPDAVPFPLKQVVLRALQKESRQRFQTAMEMYAALSDIGASPLIPQPVFRAPDPAPEPPVLIGTVTSVPHSMPPPNLDRRTLGRPLSRKTSGRAWLIAPLILLALGGGGIASYFEVPAVHDFFQPTPTTAISIRSVDVVPRSVAAGQPADVIVWLSSGCASPDQVQVRMQRGSNSFQEVKNFSVKSYADGTCALIYRLFTPAAKRPQKLKVLVSAAGGNSWPLTLTVTKSAHRRIAEDSPIVRHRPHPASRSSSRISAHKPVNGAGHPHPTSAQGTTTGSDEGTSPEEKPNLIQGDDSTTSDQKSNSPQGDDNTTGSNDSSSQ